MKKKLSPKVVTMVVAAGVAAYLLFFREKSGGGSAAGGPPPVPAGPNQASLGNPIWVGKNELVSTRTTKTTTARSSGYSYAPITNVSRNSAGEIIHSFRSPVAGYFTRELLQENGRLYAEVKPA